MTAFTIGALSISSFPLTSEFTTKTMISQAAADEGLVAVYFMFAAASAGVFLHAGIKFPWFVFFQKDSGLRPKDAPWNMGLAMVIFSALCLLIGIFPEYFYRFLPYQTDYQVYTPGEVFFYLQLLLFSGLAFFLLLPLMKRTLTISLDSDWFWRVVLHRFVIFVVENFVIAGIAAESKVATLLAWLGAFNRRHLGTSQSENHRGVFARTWPIGITALWIAILLSAYVFAYFVS